MNPSPQAEVSRHLRGVWRAQARPKPALAGSSVRIRELAEDGSLADMSGLSDKGFSAGVKVVDKKFKKEGVILSTDTCNVRVEWCDSGSTEAVKTSLFLEGAFRPLANQKVHQEVELADFRSVRETPHL